jgi:metallopeptidase MepB
MSQNWPIAFCHTFILCHHRTLRHAPQGLWLARKEPVLTHPAKDMRDASSEASRLFDDATIESFLREDIFKLVDAVLQKCGQLDAESYHYLRRRHRKHLNYGLKIPSGPARNSFAAARKRIAELSRECQKNYNLDNSGSWIEQRQLGGVPESVLSRFKMETNEIDPKCGSA